MGLFDFFKSRPTSKDEYVPPTLNIQPTPIIKKTTPVKEEKQIHFPTCPSCKKTIEAIPKRSGTCIHCNQKYYNCKDPENGKYIFTNIEGKNRIEKKMQHLRDLEGARNNRASFEAAHENSEGVKKIWMYIPGLTSTYCKENHQRFEEIGPQEMEYEYSPGLKYPGDYHCKNPNELEGCICSIGYEVD